MNNRIKFTTWEKYKLAWLERQMGKKLTTEEKAYIVWGLGWRAEKTTPPLPHRTK